MNKKITAIAAAALAALIVPMAACGDNQNADQTITLEDGSIYVGKVVDGVPNGEGVLTDFIGNEWKGKFVDGKLEGFGNYVGVDLVEYEGMFENGQFNGLGHMVDTAGNDFKGTFADGKLEGFGRIEWTTGCYYEGGWHDGAMDGMGWMTWPVGDAYFGEWEKGNPNGFGCKLFYDAAVANCVKGDYTTYNKYVGEIVNNFPHGTGIMYFCGSGGIFIGDWVEGIRDDENGIYYFEPRIEFVKFEGHFSKAQNAGWIWGEGTMWYADGRVVTGVWEGTECVEVISESTADASLVISEAADAAKSVEDNELVTSLMDKVS